MVDMTQLVIMCLCVCSGLSVAFMFYSYHHADKVPFMQGFWNAGTQVTPPPTPQPGRGCVTVGADGFACQGNWPELVGKRCEDAVRLIQAELGPGADVYSLKSDESSADLHQNRVRIACNSRGVVEYAPNVG